MNEIKLQLYLLLLCNFSSIGKINRQNTTWAHSWSDILNEDLHSLSWKTQVARMRRLFTIFIYHYFQTAYSNNRSTSALQHKEPSKYHDLYRITDVHPFINVFESCHEMLRPSSSYNLSLLLYCFVGFLCHDWQPLIVLSCLVFWILAYYSFKNQVFGFITIDFSFDFYFWYVCLIWLYCSKMSQRYIPLHH